MKRIRIDVIPLSLMSKAYELECSILGSIMLYDQYDKLTIPTDIFSPAMQELLFALGKYYKRHDHFNMVSFIAFAKDALDFGFMVEQLLFLTGMVIGPNFIEQDQERLKEVYREDTMTLFKNKSYHLVRVIEEVYKQDLPDSKKIEMVRNRFNSLCDVALKKLGGK